MRSHSFLVVYFFVDQSNGLEKKKSAETVVFVPPFYFKQYGAMESQGQLKSFTMPFLVLCQGFLVKYVFSVHCGWIFTAIAWGRVIVIPSTPAPGLGPCTWWSLFMGRSCRCCSLWPSSLTPSSSWSSPGPAWSPPQTQSSWEWRCATWWRSSFRPPAIFTITH